MPNTQDLFESDENEYEDDILCTHLNDDDTCAEGCSCSDVNIDDVCPFAKDGSFDQCCCFEEADEDYEMDDD
jgi:hypothetical protein